MQERRQHLRIPVTMTVRITPKGAERSSEVLVRDICTHGIGVFTKEPYEKGDRLRIDLSLQDDHKKAIHESVEGEVVWVEDLKNQNQRALGIRFERIDQEKPHLYQQIKQMEQRLNQYQNS